ncbi:hypothetical protein Tsubulata_038004 [Turnera subulata]|uniref:DUF4283 domain-containing protein n=1 Tax=Turnera subulata TaxID=218843 RepID=A0A9Q0F601_9ROSI|nr:hypothetical protein Tsubulata_038004 [Turnera subulata]
MAGSSKFVINLRDDDSEIIPKPNNVFLLGFEMEEDRKHVLKGSPWLVSNLHLCLKPWTQEMILSQIEEAQDISSSEPKQVSRTEAGADNSSVAAIVEDLDAQTPVHASASKPSWKRLARTTKVHHRTTAEELVRDYEMSQWAKEYEAAKKIETVLIGRTRKGTGHSQ